MIRNGACVSVPVTEERNVVQFTASGHVNFFANLEEGKQVEGVANKEHELENKKEQEDYEKQIGLLTYLGQGSKESTGESAWYEKPSLLKTLQNQSQEEVNQKAERAKDMFDPLRVIRHYIGKPETTKKEQTKFSTDLRFPAVASVPLKLISGTETKDKKRKRKSEREHTKSKKRKKEKSKRRSSDDSDSSKKKKKKKSSKKRPSSSEEEKDLESESDDSDTEKKRQLAILRAKRIEREKAERVKKKPYLVKYFKQLIKNLLFRWRPINFWPKLMVLLPQLTRKRKMQALTIAIHQAKKKSKLNRSKSIIRNTIPI